MFSLPPQAMPWQEIINPSVPARGEISSRPCGSLAPMALCRERFSSPPALPAATPSLAQVAHTAVPVVAVPDGLLVIFRAMFRGDGPSVHALDRRVVIQFDGNLVFVLADDLVLVEYRTGGGERAGERKQENTRHRHPPISFRLPGGAALKTESERCHPYSAGFHRRLIGSSGSAANTGQLCQRSAKKTPPLKVGLSSGEEYRCKKPNHGLKINRKPAEEAHVKDGDIEDKRDIFAGWSGCGRLNGENVTPSTTNVIRRAPGSKAGTEAHAAAE
ncbi:MAG: hypothetical protein V3V55_00390 [Rhodospirillales bacterium]